MNTYFKYYPNVFLAKCEEAHEKGETIKVTTKYGVEHDCIVFNQIGKKEGFFYYSIVRADGYNHKEQAKRKAERLLNASYNATKKSDSYYHAAHRVTEGVVFGQPILIGHHSEKYHRRAIEKSNNAMRKSVETQEQAGNYEARAKFWEQKANKIDLSMPESLEFYQYEFEKAKAKHEGLKNGTIKRDHSFSLTYAKKEVNDLETKLKIAKRLWE
jgi:hypothetical protein